MAHHQLLPACLVRWAVLAEIVRHGDRVRQPFTPRHVGRDAEDSRRIATPGERHQAGLPLQRLQQCVLEALPRPSRAWVR